MTRNRTLQILPRLRIAHRLRALFGAAATVTSPWRLVVWEIIFFPLRPLIMLAGWITKSDPSTSWKWITWIFGGNINGFHLTRSGRFISIRSGTADLFTLYEINSKNIYDPPEEAINIIEQISVPLRILDLGSNIGLFALEALRIWPRSSVISFEPDPDNFAILEKNLYANHDLKWQIIQAGASVKDGNIPFLSGHFAVSRISSGANQWNTRVEVVDIFPYLQECDFLKMDIEGGEWTILQDARLKTLTARVIVLEYHPWGCPTHNPEKTAREALEKIGFQVGPPEDLEEGAGTFWAWR